MGEEGHHTVTVDYAVKSLNVGGDSVGCVDARMLFPLKPIQIHSHVSVTPGIRKQSNALDSVTVSLVYWVLF